MISKPLYLIILLILTSNKLENFPQYLETGCCPRVNCSSQNLPAASAISLHLAKIRKLFLTQVEIPTKSRYLTRDFSSARTLAALHT